MDCIHTPMDYIHTPMDAPGSSTHPHPMDAPWSIHPHPGVWMHHTPFGRKRHPGGTPHPRTGCALLASRDTPVALGSGPWVEGDPHPRAHARASGNRNQEIGNYANREKRKVCKLKRKMKENPTALDLKIAHMPPLRHSIPGKPYNVRSSEVARWLCTQPDVMQWIFEKAKDRGAIVYDKDTGTWRGVNYEG